MKRISTLASVLLIISVFLTACGQGSTQPTVTSPQSENPTNAPAPAVTDAPFSPSEEPTMPTDEPPSGPVEVQITLGDNWIQSSQTTFKVGVPYTFVITNTGRRNHMFDISKPAEKTTNAIREALNNALLAVSDRDLPPGAQVTVEFTFTAPAGPDELEFACLIEKHYKGGQYLAIIVEP